MTQILVIVTRYLGEGVISIHRDRAVGISGRSYPKTRFQLPMLSEAALRELLAEIGQDPQAPDG